MFNDDPRIKQYTYKNLNGRYIHVDSKNKNNKRVFLIIYGQHATIEYLIPVIEAIAVWGEVYVVDTPGFGGMDAPYKLGEKPTLEFYSGHIKNVFDTILPENKKITVIGISFGFQIATSFLYKYDDYIERLDDLVSFVGLVSTNNFRISRKLEYILRVSCGFGKTRGGSWIISNLILRDFILYNVYLRIVSKRNTQIKDEPQSKKIQFAKDQSWLWRINDVRTHAQTAWDFLFKTDLTSNRINCDVVHIGVPLDHFLNDKIVVRDLNEIFKSVENYSMHLKAHAPVSMDNTDEVSSLVPEEVKLKLYESKN